MSDLEHIKSQVDMLALACRDTTLKRVAATHGGEWAGACPFCGGKDRFRVQPKEQRWFCRGCSNGLWGDAIDYIQRKENISFTQALALLSPSGSEPVLARAPAAETQPKIDRAKWTEAAYQFLEECEQNLWDDNGKGARAYLHSRCLNDDMLKLWGIGYSMREGYADVSEWGMQPESKLWMPKGIVIPCHDAAGLHYMKIRRRTGRPKYYVIPGGESWMFGLSTYREVTTAFLFEGEFDVMLAYQTGFTGCGYASMPASGQDLKVEYQPFFESIIDVIVAFDNDAAGQREANKLCKRKHFTKALPYPYGKDLTEFAQMGGDVFEWLYQQMGILSDGSKRSYTPTR